MFFRDNGLDGRQPVGGLRSERERRLRGRHRLETLRRAAAEQRSHEKRTRPPGARRSQAATDGTFLEHEPTPRPASYLTGAMRPIRKAGNCGKLQPAC